MDNYGRQPLRSRKSGVPGGRAGLPMFLPIVALVATAVCGVAFAQLPSTPPERTGFPKVIVGGGAAVGSQPAVADLDNDGTKEIIVGTKTRKLYVINADGNVRTGWPQTLPAEVVSAPAIGDVDGDGFPDIVVGYKGVTDPSGNGGVSAYKRDGTLIWAKSTLDIDGDTRPEGVYSTPAIGNVDGVAGNEVAFGSFDFRVYCVSGATGANLAGWPKDVRDTVWSSPALHDMNGDGRLDIIIGVDTHAEGPPFNTPNGGALHVFKFDGAELPGFPVFIDQTMMSSPAVGDIAGDNKAEIVVGGGVFYTGAVGRKVYAFNCDGTAVTGWPVTVDSQVFDSPALADLDGNGKLDVIITDEGSAMPANLPTLYAFRGNGTQIFKMIPQSFFGTTPNADNPIAADITGDGVPEILVAVNTEIVVVSATGTQLTEGGPPHSTPPAKISYYMNTSTSGAVVADFGDGKISVVATSGEMFPSPTDTRVDVWVPGPSIAAGGLPWPMFRQNSLRTGVIPGSVACPATPGRNFFTLTPCRVVDTRNPNGPLGGPAMVAQQARDFTIAGNCGVPLAATAVALNATITASSSFGDLRIFPTGGAGGGTSTMNWRVGQTRANNAIVPLGSGGSITVIVFMPTGTAHLILDVVGYFQ